MNRLSKPKFSESEIQILKKVTIFSTLACFLIVAGSWFFNFYNTKKLVHHTAPAAQQRTLSSIDIEAHRVTALKYLQSGNPNKAIPHLKRILFYDKNDSQSQLNLANAYLEAGEFSNALSLYDKLQSEILSDSILKSICTRRGVALYYLNRQSESKKALNECLTTYPQSAEGLCFLGQIEAASGTDSATIVSTFQKAIESDPSYGEARYQLARFLMQKQDYIKAREQLVKTLQTDPLHAKSHARLGMVYYYLGNIELSRISYQTAIALNPSDYNTRYNLGELYYTSIGDTTNALKEYKKAVEENPDHKEANFKIGLICMKNHMVKEAIHYFENALAPEPEDVRILLQLAVSFEKINQIEQAKDIYRRILRIDELNSIARQKLKLLNMQH